MAQMNETLLRKVMAHIKADPLRVYMEKWAVSQIVSLGNGVAEVLAGGPMLHETLLYPDCGTICCLYGWGKILDQPDPEAAMANPHFMARHFGMNRPYDEVCRDAKSLFGLADIEAAMRLTLLQYWPQSFYEDYCRAERDMDRVGMTDAVVARIEWFIATGGTDGAIAGTKEQRERRHHMDSHHSTFYDSAYDECPECAEEEEEEWERVTAE